MITRIIYTALCLVALFGCLDDKGSYSYIELNEVESIEGIEEAYSITKFEDTLRIAPTINFKLGEDTDYEFEWTVSHWEYNDETRERDNYEIVISTERNLEFIADHQVPYKDLFAVYRVKNKATDVSYTHHFEIRVQNAYQYGYFFLCENEDNGEIFLVRDNGKTIDGLYEQLTGQELVGKPYCMESFRNGVDSDLVIFTDKGPDYGAVLDFDKMDYKWPALKCFHEENTGGDLVVNDFKAPAFSDIYTIVNGNYYFTGRMAFGDYKPYIGIDVPDVNESCDNVEYLAFGLTLLHGTDPGTIYVPGNWGAIDPVLIDGAPLKLPGKSCFMAAEPGGSMYGAGVNAHLIIKGDDGVITETVLNARMDFATWSNVYVISRQNAFPAPELITDETKFVNSNSERYFYFSSENRIYRYNYDAPDDNPALIAELPADEKISYLYLDYIQEGYSKYDDKFVVGTYDNSGQANGSVYFVNMDGSIETSYENVCGKIVDMAVKK
ncbi:MAG: PKD-like family lipoprotein [Bacteroidales bacterium]|nr:PKD-like family lipoprotein [Bacteroidales bacterium]